MVLRRSESFHARSSDDHRARSKRLWRVVSNAGALSEKISLPLEGFRRQQKQALPHLRVELRGLRNAIHRVRVRACAEQASPQRMDV